MLSIQFFLLAYWWRENAKGLAEGFRQAGMSEAWITRYVGGPGVVVMLTLVIAGVWNMGG